MWATSVFMPSVFVVLTFISSISNAQVNDCPWPSIPNSQRNCSDDNRYSSVCTYTCDTGYELDGNSSVQCTTNKTWSDQPSCLIINCTWPTIPNSQRNCTDDNQYSSMCYYTCESGYELDGNSSVQCTANKTWSDEPTCPITHCSSEPDVSNSHRFCTHDNEYKSVCSYTCKTGYELRGVPIVTCLDTKTWTPKPSCPKISCAWPTIPNSKRSCTDSNRYSSVCTYTCDTGYELQGSPTAKCNADKTWSNQPACTKRVNKDDTLKKVLAPVFSLVGAIYVVIVVIVLCCNTDPLRSNGESNTDVLKHPRKPDTIVLCPPRKPDTIVPCPESSINESDVPDGESCISESDVPDGDSSISESDVPNGEFTPPEIPRTISDVDFQVSGYLESSVLQQPLSVYFPVQNPTAVKPSVSTAHNLFPAATVSAPFDNGTLQAPKQTTTNPKSAALAYEGQKLAKPERLNQKERQSEPVTDDVPKCLLMYKKHPNCNRPCCTSERVNCQCPIHITR